MSSKSSIEWTDATWNPVRGCSRISEGCRNCYAERVAARFSAKGQAYHGLAKMTKSGPRWTGKLKLIEKHLDDPLGWKRPRRVFVNSMSDLFHEDLSDVDIEKVFHVMEFASQHHYQILTKRPERMLSYLENHRGIDGTPWFKHAPSHIWIGVSIEDQKTAEYRLRFLERTRSFICWVSCEPLLGPIDFYKAAEPGSLQWVVVGGESGPHARPMKLQWARQIRRYCSQMKIPFFMKQLGSVLAKGGKGGRFEDLPRGLRIRRYPG